MKTLRLSEEDLHILLDNRIIEQDDSSYEVTNRIREYLHLPIKSRLTPKGELRTKIKDLSNEEAKELLSKL